VVTGAFLLMLGATFALLGAATLALGLEGGPPLAMCVVEATMMTTFAVVLALGAHGLHRRKRLPWVRAAATLVCLFFPLGTVLGVLTFRWVNEHETLFAR